MPVKAKVILPYGSLKYRIGENAILGDPGAVSRGREKRRYETFRARTEEPLAYRHSPNHFQAFKRILRPDWAKKCFVLLCPNCRTASPEFSSCDCTRRLLRSEDATAAKTTLKNMFAFFQSSPIYFVKCRRANPPGVGFLRTMSKYRRINKISSSLFYLLHKTLI